MIDISDYIQELYREVRIKVRELRRITKEKVIKQCPFKNGDKVKCGEFQPGEIMRIDAQEIEVDTDKYEWFIIVENDKMGIIKYTESEKNDIKLVENHEG